MRKECQGGGYAVVSFIKYFKHFLLGRHFVVRTDHAALQWLWKTPEPMGQQARWIGFLEEFDFDVVYRPGRHHEGLEVPVESLTAVIPGVQNDSDEAGVEVSNAGMLDWSSAEKTLAQHADRDIGVICRNDCCATSFGPVCHVTQETIVVVVMLVNDSGKVKTLHRLRYKACH